MRRIAVGIDGSTGSRTALMWAARLAGAVGAEIVAISVCDSSRAQVSGQIRGQSLEQRRTVLEESWIQPAVETGVTVSTIVKDGDGRRVLLKTTEEEGVDLVVLGRTGASGGPGFLHLGSAVEYAAHHTSTPLAIIPGEWSGEIRRIIVGLDGSADSQAALAWATDIAPSVEASVIAIKVEEPFLEWTPESSPDNWRRGVERDLETWTEPLSEMGVAVDVVAQRDLLPADGLLAVATARRGDLIVIGTRGVGGFTGLRAGGVALKVLHRAHLPLVLVPPR